MAAPSNTTRVSVLIPALNEEEAIGLVLDEIPRPPVDEVVVVDNGSTDKTAEVARRHGARVIKASPKGYGTACLAGMEAIGTTDIVVFLDGDHSDYPEELPRLIEPILADEADLVIGSRVLGGPERGSLTAQQVWGNRLACFLMGIILRHRYSDLGPFRAIRWEALQGLEMRDRTWGWTVEMQMKAIRDGLRVAEVPVRYRKRIGQSKISGTAMGSLKAGYKILSTIARHARR